MNFENLEFKIIKLYKYCLKLSSSPWIAEDLVQETVLKVYKIKNSDIDLEGNILELVSQ